MTVRRRFVSHPVVSHCRGGRSVHEDDAGTDICGAGSSSRSRPLRRVLTLSPTFMLMDWVPTHARLAGKHQKTKTRDMHVNRFSLESVPFFREGDET